MVRFISCDWGTSSFRLRLIDTADLKVVGEERNQRGISVVYRQFLELKEKSPSIRESFYKQVISEGVEALEKSCKGDLSGLMIICSGMVTSSIGLREVPFTPLPFDVSGKNLGMDFIGASVDFGHPLLLLSGLRSDTDVMRGEESELVGVIQMLDDFSGEGLFILPGTHSKHVRVTGYQVSEFTTFMTGEFFDLLCQQSILKDSISSDDTFDFTRSGESFRSGVKAGLSGSLLSQAFLVRTRVLFGKANKTDNYHYLSGLLIGNELKELTNSGNLPIYLCCTSHLEAQYRLALKTLGIDVMIIPAATMDQAVVRGQFKIYNQNLNHERSIFLGSF
ncbi:2-dehydro-3-deoxygalactonokinase [Lunatibacter salilacus]|uniref:2-dehydro-3-deoxygalactonokinase n=1 Tax=Lunatibacter salilacus TaxID=2483804 RepID=UPI00131E79B8|nr:2-dehydro-3-deoxygalactonokinase [Lunatibacter salilacus]